MIQNTHFDNKKATLYRIITVHNMEDTKKYELTRKFDEDEPQRNTRPDTKKKKWTNSELNWNTVDNIFVN